MDTRKKIISALCVGLLFLVVGYVNYLSKTYHTHHRLDGLNDATVREHQIVVARLNSIFARANNSETDSVWTIRSGGNGTYPRLEIANLHVAVLQIFNQYDRNSSVFTAASTVEAVPRLEAVSARVQNNTTENTTAVPSASPQNDSYPTSHHSEPLARSVGDLENTTSSTTITDQDEPSASPRNDSNPISHHSEPLTRSVGEMVTVVENTEFQTS